MSQVTENKVIAAPVPMTPLQEFWHYFKRNKGAVVGLVYVVVMIVIAVFANFLAPYNPADQFRDSLLAPPFWQDGGSMAHLLGTDDVGRDILSRLMYGARLSLLVGCLVVVLSLILGVVLCANTAFAAPQVVDKVVAIVDNGVVLESDVDGMMKSVKLNAQQAGQQLPDNATLRHQILERLIMDNIQLQMAKRMGLEVSDSELDNAINGIAAQNHLTPQQLRSRLAADGLDYKAYRAQIRKEMLISEVRNNEVRRRVTILPQEVDALAKQISSQNSGETAVNLSHILIPLPENPTQQQVSEAQ